MRLVERILLRAPLLPLGATSLDDSPLGELAVRIASPSLAAGLARGDDAARAAWSRYASRARFRAVPHGLFAGVGVGRLGDVTEIRTGQPEAHLTYRFAVLRALARELLDDPPSRLCVRVRVAPSVLRHGDHAVWIGPEGRALEAVVDDELAAILEAAARWAPYAKVAAAAGDDQLVLELIDDGLLADDLGPPLVGPPPRDAFIERLRSVRSDKARQLRERLLTESPDHDQVHATLVFRAAQATVARAGILRAATLVPTLVRLAAALSPPTAERDLDPGIAAAASAAEESFGPGALDLAALALGGYGVRPDEVGRPHPRPPPPSALVVLLIDRFAAAAASDGQARFSGAELDAVLAEAPMPATVELQLTPRREPAGAPPGTGWLLGWHAPAGATWGRFAHALLPVGDALHELAKIEPPGRLDVAFAPDLALADLGTHPPVRAAALALSGWPAGPALTPADLTLVTGGAALALAGGTPSPLSRIRSTLAPAGVYQLLAGWSLHRQHAPWALVLGPLADLAAIPRVVIDGFVVTPASWRLPADRAPAALAAWRAVARVPRHVQIGHEDELLPVDLEAGDAARSLVGVERVTEIWPPLEEPPLDESGRRVELVAAVVLTGEADPVDTPPRRRVAPPSEAGPEPGWRTFLLHGPRDRQDRLLVEAIGPAIAAARAARAARKPEIDAWFFLRYVDDTPRHHLRLRVRGDVARFSGRLADALAPAIAAGDVTTWAEAPFWPERARYGTALPAVLGAAETASDLALTLLENSDDDIDLLAVRALDAMARALGLARRARHALATELRAAFEPAPAGSDSLYRRHARALRDALHRESDDRLRHFVKALAPARRARAAVADLCHLLLNRLVGIDADREAFAYIAWQRTLEGLVATPSRRR